MSAHDEGFLTRWSRVKRAGDAGVAATEGNAPPLAGDQERGPTADPEAADFDVTKLPAIEDLVAESNFAAFLQKGVPEELKRLALRKAWSLDPVIRDFVEVAENQYDWNAPDGVPGFGPLAADTDIRQLLAQAIGERTEVLIQKTEQPVAKEVAEALPPEPIEPPPTAMAAVPVQAAPANSATSELRTGQSTRQRSRHGGALPQVADMGYPDVR